jgi:crossover junction endodeoxyribonuclease RuvC
MKIIAVDPGYDRVGVAIVEKLSGKEVLLYSTCIVTDKKQSFYDRMQYVRSKIIVILKDFQPQQLVIEELYFAKNTKTALRVAEAKGIIVGTILEKNIPITELHPNHIKIAITGYGAAKKEDILFMLPKLIEIGTEKRFDDELDAIAIGVAYFAYKKINM